MTIIDQTARRPAQTPVQLYIERRLVGGRGQPHRPPPAGVGSVVNRCGGGWSAVSTANAPDHGVLPTHRLAQARQRPEQEPSRWIFGPHRDDMDVNRPFTLKSSST